LALDGDGHVYELHTASFLDFIEQPYRQQALDRAARLSSIPQLVIVSDGWDRQLGGRYWSATSTDAAAWLQALDEGRLDRAVLYPTFGLLLGVMPDPDFAAAYARAYNTWAQAEILEPGQGRLLPAGCLPPHDSTVALEELRHIQELQLSAAMLPADGDHRLGSSAFDSLYREAESIGMPLTVHAAGTHLGGRYFPKFIQVHAFNHPASVLAQFTSIMLEGIPSRFPALRLAFLEIGATWLPWYLDRLDEEYELRGDAEAPSLTARPSEIVYSSGQIFFTAEVEERLLPVTLNLFDAPRVMYASDWPHWDHNYPQSLNVLRSREDLTTEQIDGLTKQAASLFYRLDQR
jgi:uncharacterized protein